LKTFPSSIPNLFFFRHGKNVSGVAAGKKFGEKLFYKWWKRACKNLNITDVDLYGGTRHSSAVDLRQYYTPEQIKRSTMHSTNKAFERYFQISKDELQGMYETTSGKHLENKKATHQKDKCPNLQHINGRGGKIRTYDLLLPRQFIYRFCAPI